MAGSTDDRRADCKAADPRSANPKGSTRTGKVGEAPLAWETAVGPGSPVGAWFRLATLASHWSRATGPLVVPTALPPVSVVYQVGEPGYGRFAAWFNATVGGLLVLTARSPV